MTPLTPSQALQAHSHALTGYEQSEILNQQDIYFLGLGANKIEGQPHSSDLNHGYASHAFMGRHLVMLIRLDCLISGAGFVHP